MQTLQCLYQANIKRFAEFVNTFPDENFQGPLLIEPSGYFHQPKKLFVIGQETFGWGCEYANVEAQLKLYKDFNMGQNYYSTPFWNMTRKVESILGIEKYSCAWSNLNRFDHKGGSPSGKHREEILRELSKLDFLVKLEVEILQPDVCLFYTNRKYDQRIVNMYPGVQFFNIEGLPANHFVRLAHDDLPKKYISHTSSKNNSHTKMGGAVSNIYEGYFTQLISWFKST